MYKLWEESYFQGKIKINIFEEKKKKFCNTYFLYDIHLTYFLFKK